MRGDPGVIEIIRARAQDWPRLKALRLEALADTPIGYLESLEQARSHPDEDWRARARRGADGGDSVQVFAQDGERLVATAVGFLRGPGTAWLAAVYVSPGYRGQGLLERMTAAVAAWCQAQGATRLVLQVHEDNARARSAYARLGFIDTGQTEAYPLDPSRVELLLARPLG